MNKRKLKNKILSFFLIMALSAGIYSLFPAVTVKAFSQKDVIDAVSAGQSIKLTDDVMMLQMLVVPAGADIYIDLNGHKLDRGLRSLTANGSVIKISAGAKLKLMDSTGSSGGLITGGYSSYGAGIYNEGTLVLEGGTISENIANDDTAGYGGGIYNAPGASATLKGGKIEYNRATYGGGVYNAAGATVNFQETSYEIKKGAITYKIVDNISIDHNRMYKAGAGFYNCGTVNMKGAPNIDNNYSSDLHLTKDTVINVTGSLEGTKGATARVGIIADNEGIMVTTGFGSNNSGKRIDEYFFSDTSVVLSDYISGSSDEAKLYSSNKTLVQEFRKGVLTKTQEYDDPMSAWQGASAMAEPGATGYSYYNFIAYMSDEAAKDLKDIVNDNATTQFFEGIGEFFGIISRTKERDLVARYLWNYRYNEAQRVEITLGSDWEHDTELRIAEKTSIVVDLNGHYIKRTRNYEDKKNGGVFYVCDGAKFTIKDSNPESRGYDGIEGGVITGGASSNTGGAIHMEGSCVVDVRGGTIYECFTTYHGGAICMAGDTDEHSSYYGIYISRILNMSDCRIYKCQSQPSTLGYSNGGGLYIREDTRAYLYNVTIQDCYSDDSGGGIYMENDRTALYMNGCTLIGNNCLDNGGALCVRGSDESRVEPVGAYNCTFANNEALESGGAVFISGKGKTDEDSAYGTNATQFCGCVFRGNITGDDGAAIYVNSDQVVIDGCTITGNYTEDYGAVYVDSYYDVGVKGLLVVKDNYRLLGKNSSGLVTEPGENFVLQKGIATTARIYSGGLYPGSYIVIDSTKDGDIVLSNNMLYSEMQYFHPETGSISYEKTGEIEAAIYYSSIFGSGSLPVIVIIALIAAIGTAAVIIIVKRKGKNNGSV